MEFSFFNSIGGGFQTQQQQPHQTMMPQQPMQMMPAFGFSASNSINPNKTVLAPRRRLTLEQTRSLQAYFLKNPKPSQTDRELIATNLNLPSRCVQIWFQNKRAKAKREAIERVRPHPLPQPPMSKDYRFTPLLPLIPAPAPQPNFMPVIPMQVSMMPQQPQLQTSMHISPAMPSLMDLLPQSMSNTTHQPSGTFAPQPQQNNKALPPVTSLALMMSSNVSMSDIEGFGGALDANILMQDETIKNMAFEDDFFNPSTQRAASNEKRGHFGF